MTPLNPRTSVKKTGWLAIIGFGLLILIGLYALVTFVAGLADRQGARQAMRIRVGSLSSWWARMRHPFTSPVIAVPTVCKPSCSCDSTGEAKVSDARTTGESWKARDRTPDDTALELELKSMGLTSVENLR